LFCPDFNGLFGGQCVAQCVPGSFAHVGHGVYEVCHFGLLSKFLDVTVPLKDSAGKAMYRGVKGKRREKKSGVSQVVTR